MVVFAVLPLTGDPVTRYLQARHQYSPTDAEVAALRHELGLDRPLVGQYLGWAGNAVRGDFGLSYQTGRPVGPDLWAHLAPTLVLALSALTIALVVSLALGLACAAAAGRWPDAALRAACAVGVGVPDFVVGLVLLQAVVIGLGVGGVISDGALAHVGLPAVALAVLPAATWTQLLRAGLLDALGSRFALVAAARGAGRTRILLHHALPNALPPYLTAVAVGIGFMLGGTAVVEAVFSWPGVGLWLVSAVRARDVPQIQAFAVLATTTFVLLSLAADTLIARLDPRTREGTG
ncbi:hypothetical protein BJF78_13600 [Pseudonocardia sp. CNS-139]|nr:hypothetical protein BJF78_13600 [Pseudonocardia sp. CNS-139]